ncbi:MAG: hypothetical protein AAB276_00250, partial [Pseudomonadota bacterium]
MLSRDALLLGNNHPLILPDIREQIQVLFTPDDNVRGSLLDLYEKGIRDRIVVIRGTEHFPLCWLTKLVFKVHGRDVDVTQTFLKNAEGSFKFSYDELLRQRIMLARLHGLDVSDLSSSGQLLPRSVENSLMAEHLFVSMTDRERAMSRQGELNRAIRQLSEGDIDTLFEQWKGNSKDDKPTITRRFFEQRAGLRIVSSPLAPIQKMALRTTHNAQRTTLLNAPNTTIASLGMTPLTIPNTHTAQTALAGEAMGSASSPVNMTRREFLKSLKRLSLLVGGAALTTLTMDTPRLLDGLGLTDAQLAALVVEEPIEKPYITDIQ